VVVGKDLLHGASEEARRAEPLVDERAGAGHRLFGLAAHDDVSPRSQKLGPTGSSKSPCATM
jgi:hypothetical protein